ncbi:MAG: Nramp family divalent metal transporter [Rudanella sp.]|nr:Nramp family divalent metal transporter [Rudanella sp.]
MPKSLSLRSGLGSVLFWSVISAAFIGPGTVTACSMAGSRYGLSLLWALTFSTIGTILLQEAAARITIASGRSLGEIVAGTYGLNTQTVPGLLFAAVALGCAAYQAGNILGAVSGLSLLTGLPVPVLTLLVGAICTALLWIGSTRLIANFLGLIVFLMGIAFAYVAVSTSPNTTELATSLVVPTLPNGSLVLVIGLIGTTIVPYNLFLGSGIGQGQSLGEMRWGIGVAVLIGGLISMAILMAGTLVTGDFSFQNVAQTLSGRVGPWAGSLFAFGLFAAGFTSALTAPLAAAVTAKSLLGWPETSMKYRAVWLVVMGVGLLFGLLGVKPVPVIILAQAANGLLLPIVTVFLLLAVNNRRLVPNAYRNSLWQNLAMGLVVAVTAFLGLRNVWLVFQ